MRDAAYQVRDLKGSTAQGIGLTVSGLVHALAHEVGALIPVSVRVGDGVCASLPCVLGPDGPSAPLWPPMTDARAARRGSTRSRCSPTANDVAADLSRSVVESSRRRDRRADLERRGRRRRRRVQHVHGPPDRADREVVDELAVGARSPAPARPPAPARDRRARSPAPAAAPPRRSVAGSASAPSRRRRSASCAARTAGSPGTRTSRAGVARRRVATRSPRGRTRAPRSGRRARARRSRA